MVTPFNPTDVARLGHRYQPFVKHGTTAREIVADRVQRLEPSITQRTETYFEIGNLDPVGDAQDPPEFRVVIEENLHNSELDLLLAGKASDATSYNLLDYVNNGVIQVNLLERTNAGVVCGELEVDNCVTGEIQWRWQVGQPITATYTLEGKLGKRWTDAYTPHVAWGAFDTSSPGAIRAKDARLFLGGATNRIYRLQGFTLRVQYRVERVNEVGTRSLVGVVIGPPSTTLDMDFAAADAQPDDLIYYNYSSPVQYYDYVNANLLTGSVIRVYDPEGTEANTVLRAWKVENLRAQSSTPVLANVRGLATKRYSFVVPRVTTSGTGGVLLYVGDVV